ncbi:LysR family transcriptional regulator [Burkholderia sp. Ed8]|uniref:LysR family transcriptional regulator n=1 Tax=Burkholderia sp. Ed8 TaxID=3112957 RepID=UPI00345DC4C3
MTNIPTELLRTFVKAVDLGNFTRAGEAIGRSQSAVSLQIQRLEALLDVELFVRGMHRLKLTDEGVTLLNYARRILSLNDEAVGRLRPSNVAGSIRMGAPHEYNAALLPAILGKFSKDYPNVTLEVVCDLSKNLLARQKKGQLDIVIALHEDTTQSGINVVTEPLIWIGGVRAKIAIFIHYLWWSHLSLAFIEVKSSKPCSALISTGDFRLLVPVTPELSRQCALA